MGRKALEFTAEQEEQIKKLAEISATMEEIAYVMGCSRSALRNFTHLIDEGKARGKVKLRRAQYIKAVDEGNPTLLIWLGKQMLGQSDNPVGEGENLILPWEVNTDIEE
jgi:hypothetical protein